ncbi:50S ribosomal protein L11 methyltransferase [uncultured Desulfosarcina sp.]|uniref:50S ribosomal protein L11 methyltransferase n=1 Tax=uncultured Desulfosarcina sp. TaxID=218289 RepID=UPI0029C86218|nr:50S ribosomal protein L11 methyltransferase [uncultured Desulfosarcina sp.]
MCASQSQILRFIAESPFKVSFCCLKRHFCDIHQCHPKKLKLLIASLMQTGQLCYTSHYGNSFIEISYDQPTAVSENVVIKPPLSSLKPLPGQEVVSLGRGASFGGGEHPTTRLAIQLIDELLHQPRLRDKCQKYRAVDIGTGSGILAIVAAKMGVGLVWGIDSDPCAIFEARENVRLNQLEERVKILDDDLSAITGSYDLVFANLRMPTLYGFRSTLETKTAADSVLIFSGLKTDEAHPLCEFYKEVGYFVHQKCSEKGWSAICLARGFFLNENVVPIDNHWGG